MLAIKENEKEELFVQSLMIMNCKYFVKKYDMDPIASVNINNFKDAAMMTKMGYQKFAGPFATYSTKPVLKSKM